MTINPVSAAGPANALSGQALRFILGKVEDGDRERFRGSFQRAAEWCWLTPEEQASRSKGGMTKFWRGAKKGLTSPGRGIKRLKRNTPRKRSQRGNAITEGDGAREAFEQVARELGEAWAGDLSQATWLIDNMEETWTALLETCLVTVARRHACESSWRYVIGRDGEREIEQGAIDSWAAAMRRELVSLWRRDRRLALVAAQLDAESGLGLQSALVAASREMSQRLLWIAFAVVGAALAGGGGVALMVLFIDHG